MNKQNTFRSRLYASLFTRKLHIAYFGYILWYQWFITVIYYYYLLSINIYKSLWKFNPVDNPEISFTKGLSIRKTKKLVDLRATQSMLLFKFRFKKIRITATWHTWWQNLATFRHTGGFGLWVISKQAFASSSLTLCISENISKY